MAINLKSEEIISLREAADLLPKVCHKKVHASTLWRWCHCGLWGIHLEFLYIGERTFTSVEAMQRFFIELTQRREKCSKALISKYPRTQKPRTQGRRQRDIEDATAVLIRAKIIKNTMQEVATV